MALSFFFLTEFIGQNLSMLGGGTQGDFFFFVPKSDVNAVS